MKKARIGMLSLAALALLTARGTVADAEAGIRVDATLRTPHVRVHVQNRPGHLGRYVRGHAPLYVYERYRVGPRDRRIAQRLARYTGTSPRELIYLRRQGYRWVQIGRWLELPRPVVQAAMHDHSWKRFLRHQRRLAGHGAVRYKQRRVAYLDDGYKCDD